MGSRRWRRDHLDEALAAGYAYLDEVHSVPIVDERGERRVMTRYYEIVLGQPDVGDAVEPLATKIVDEAMTSSDVEPCEWTVEVLAHL
jgi:hypothetical protein